MWLYFSRCAPLFIFICVVFTDRISRYSTGNKVVMVWSIRFLVHLYFFLTYFLFSDISDQDWTVNTTYIIKNTNKHVSFLTALKKNKLTSVLLRNLYCHTIDSVLLYGCTVYCSSCTKEKRKQLQRVIRTTLRTIGFLILCLDEIFSSHLLQSVGITTLLALTHSFQLPE